MDAGLRALEQIHARLRRRLGGRLATSRHPTRGRRRESGDRLNVVHAVCRPRGVGEGPFANKFGFDTICEQVQRVNTLSFGADLHGLAIEVPAAEGTDVPPGPATRV